MLRRVRNNVGAVTVTITITIYCVSVCQALNRHNYAYADRECDNKYVTSPGYLQWRDGGEKHMNDPITVSNLQVVMRAVLYYWQGACMLECRGILF